MFLSELGLFYIYMKLILSVNNAIKVVLISQLIPATLIQSDII
jgi:hypothetical protein